jgi:hypothetical protein
MMVALLILCAQYFDGIQIVRRNSSFARIVIRRALLPRHESNFGTNKDEE